jgi:hypothetical protein
MVGVGVGASVGVGVGGGEGDGVGLGLSVAVGVEVAVALGEVGATAPGPPHATASTMATPRKRLATVAMNVQTCLLSPDFQ